MNHHLYPPTEPFRSGMFAVDDLHTLYWEECGNPDGIPVVFLHGGPGAGCSANDRRFFQADAFRVVLFDQRGSGRSTPAGELTRNDPFALVEDIERLRVELGIERWHVFGGSWGSTLALLYAQTHPQQVLSMILRGIWLLRKEEIDWWLYQMGQIQPEIWRPFAEQLPEELRDDLLEGYWRVLNGYDQAAALAAARAWSIYEGSCCTMQPNLDYASAFSDDAMAWNLARLEAHFFRNATLQPDTLLLDQAPILADIPAFAVHGRYDLVCPVKNLDDLSRAWPKLDCEIVPDAGHSSYEPGITQQLVAAMDRIAATGSPVRD